MSGGSGPAGAGEQTVMGEDGWAREALRLDSPNQDERPTGVAIDLLLIHNISLPPGQFGTGHIENLFTNQLDCAAHPYFDALRGLRVSAHFLVARDGRLTQFVSCRRRAWHAGQSNFEGRTACNDFSIGIELEGTDTVPYESVQYQTLARLTRGLLAAYPLRAVRGHSDVAPDRKTDPGASFDWRRFSRLANLPSTAWPPGPLP